MVIYLDLCCCTLVLAHDLGLLQTDGQSKLFACVGKAFNEPPKSSLSVASTVSEKHVSDEDNSHSALRKQADEVEKVSDTS